MKAGTRILSSEQKCIFGILNANFLFFFFWRKNRSSGSRVQAAHLKEGSALIFDKCCEQIPCAALRGKGWSRAATAG